MTIVQRQQVRDAVKRALQLDPDADQDAAIDVVAQAMCLPPEAVRDAIQPEGQPA